MSESAPAALEALHHAIGTNRATIGGVKISRKDGAIHVEISSADGELAVAIPPAEALRIAAGMYQLAKDAG
jgi:hypothetical protein